MKIKYLGPNDYVNVAGYGPLFKDVEADVPDNIAKDLLATSQRQRFEAPEGWAVAKPKGKKS